MPGLFFLYKKSRPSIISLTYRDEETVVLFTIIWKRERFSQGLKKFNFLSKLTAHDTQKILTSWVLGMCEFWN